ncbi:MAG: arginine--tRNA ligase [Acetobacteraceae bacterium]
MVDHVSGAQNCLFKQYQQVVRQTLRDIVPDLPDDILDRVELTPTKDPLHGDMATNGALLAAKPAWRKPQEIAASLAERLQQQEGIASAEAAGPGFVNITLSPGIYQNLLPHILRQGAAYGESAIGGGRRVNVEYVSANPTGSMHVGHCRGAVVGDALARLLQKAGYSVLKEYYINDAGAQVTALSWVVYWRYLQKIGTSLTEDAFAALTPTGLQYMGDYLLPVADALAEKYGASLATPEKTAAPTEQWFETVRRAALDAMMSQIRADLEALGISHDVFSSEADIYAGGEVDRAIKCLEGKGLIYEGVLEPPKGKTPDDWESRPQTLFRSTSFGDDVDRALKKSNGENTYFANDVGYHSQKASQADLLIDVLGADHGGYVSRMRAAVQALTDGHTAFEVVICQIVRILKAGVPVRMSKRAGTFVTLRDLLDEVGRDAVRFTMLKRKADAQMDFDLDLVIAQTRDNPVFYVQYAHARCCSVIRAARDMFGGDVDAALAGDAQQLHTIASAAELAVIRRMASFPRMVEGAALAREPQRIAYYCGELAADFHALWNKGREDTTLRFLREDEKEASLAKLALVAAVANVLRCGLDILGVTPAEEM